MEELKAMDIVAKVGSVTVTDTSPRYMRLLEEAVAKKPLDMEKRDELMSQLAELEVKVVVADTKSVDEDDSMPF
jgi:hypothetical protein